MNNVEAQRTYFSTCDWWKGKQGQRHGSLLRHVPIQPGESVLDCGCGFGCLKRLLPGVRYTGIDLMPQFIHTAIEEQPDGEFLCGDVSEYDFAGRQFDWVLACTLFSGAGWIGEDVTTMLDKMYALCLKGMACLSNVFQPQLQAWAAMRGGEYTLACDLDAICMKRRL